MSTQFLSNLSQNYIELLKDDEYYDITIEVGKDSNVKFFRAHMNILCYRSPYLRRALASSKKKNNDCIIAHIKLQNISPEIFQIILEYIYGGILSLDEKDTSDLLKVLDAADELRLQEIVDYLQRYLIENKSEWMEQNFELTQRISSQSSNHLLKLQQFCTDFMAKSPETIFESLYFTSLSEKSLISLIKNDDIQMKEIEIWEHVLKWGLAQNPSLNTDPKTWSDDGFKTMEYTLQNCLPLIRFYSLSTREFSQRVHPYRKVLNHQLYEDLLYSHLDPDNVSTDNISLPRNIKIDGIIDSKIVNLSIISTISKWIDKMDNDDGKFAQFRELYLPYKFELLLRGSRDGLTPKKFHELCDDKHNTVAFVKVKGTEEIVGGYNPIVWESSNSWGKAEDSFIFSLKNRNSFVKDAIISNIKDTDYAINYHPEHGPCFGKDLLIYASKKSDTNIDKTFFNKPEYYEKRVREEKEFSMEDYEIFQIIKR